MRPVLPAALLLCSGCSDYELKGKEDVPTVSDTAERPAPEDTSPPVDSGPRDCDVLDAPAGAAEIDEACIGHSPEIEEVADPWSVRVQWQVRAPTTDTSATNSYSQAVIGNLDDDNGDGLIDEDDTPEVIVSAFGSTCYVLALDGLDGREKWAWRGCKAGTGLLVADVDADGHPDVVAVDTSNRAVSIDGVTGLTQWTSTTASSAYYPLVTAADLDEDGMPEVLLDDIVLSGRDGSLRFALGASTSNPYRMAAVGDVDLDGDQEIFIGGSAYDSDGTLLWTTGEVGTYGFWPILIQADADPEAEIGFVGEHWTLWNHDGSPIYSRTYGTRSQPGPPCAGDFDGDGEAEVAWPSYQNFVMYELDGTQVWSVSMDDTSGLAGCSGYDVNGDGALEILFADQSSVTIFDGATGAENYVNTGHRSGTVFEYPSVADIDHDGAAEIVITSNYWSGTWGVVTAFEHDGVGWPASGSTWATHDFAITNIQPDGTVPVSPDPSWLVYNVYRARVAADDPSRPDLTVGIVDVCFSGCEPTDPVRLSFQVSNVGGADVEEETSWALYRNDGGVLDLLQTGTVLPIRAGRAAASVEVELAPPNIGSAGLVITVDDDGTGVGVVTECDEENNRVDYTATECGR